MTRVRLKRLYTYVRAYLDGFAGGIVCSHMGAWRSVGLVVALAACSGNAPKPNLPATDNSMPTRDGGASGPTSGVGAGGGGIDSGADASPAATDAGTLDAGIDAGAAGPCVCDGSATPAVACKDECNLAFEPLFSENQLPSFYLTIFDDNGGGGNASSWDNLFVNCTHTEANSNAPPVECDHQLATFHAEYDPDPEDGVAETITTPEIEVGVHRKGRASWDDTNEKPGLKVKFTAFGGERFMGLARLSLNNAIQDPSMLRERVSYRVARAAGVPAPLANNAKLYVRPNNASAYEYYGVYVNVQTLDRRFVEYHYGEVTSGVGNLFDTYNDVYFTELDRATCRDQAGPVAGDQEARFELETNVTTNDRSDLTALINSVFKVGCSTSAFCGGANCCCNPTNWDQTNFFENVSALADTHEFLRAFAVQTLNTDWDGFAGTRNNFKLYHDLVSNKFVIFPWGTDQSLDYQEKVEAAGATSTAGAGR